MADSSSAHDVVSDGGELRKLSELRVIDLKAELKRRSLDTSGNKSMLSERLKRVIEEEGGDPDEIVVYLETASKKTPKRAAKGKKQESDGLEECSMEDDSGDGQDETDVNLDSLNEMDIMDMSVLDEAEIDNGIPADCEDYDADEILDTLSSDGKEDILQESVNENGNDQQGLLSSEVLEMEDGNMDSPEEELKFVVKEEPEEEETNEEIAPRRKAPIKPKIKTKRVGPVLTALASSTAASSGRNLWVSGLSSTTRATDLKNLFSKYGKVVGAKVVTNAKSPGARCYGFVTMCSTEEVTKCISHLHRTELHGRMISVERAKNEPAGKKPVDKAEAKKAATERRLSSESKSEKSDPTKDKKAAGAEEDKDGKDSERTVVMDKSKGEPVISVKTKSKERSTKSRDRKSPSKEKKDILSFNQIIEQRERERQRQREREIREVERRRHSGERDRDSRSERERIRIFREKEERERLMRKRNWLEVEKQRLEADRMEREFLERERLRVEYERRREQERIHREREELRRQQDQLRYEQDRRPLKRPYDMDSRKDDWPDKRLCMDDRYGRSDFGRPERYHDFDHRDRSRYNEDMLMDRRDTSRGMMDRDGQFDRDRHGRDSRDNWGYDRRGLNPREGRDWDSRKMDGERGWQGDRGMPGQSHMVRGGMAGRGGYMPGSSQGMSSALNRQNQMMQGGGGMQGGAFGRRY